MNTSRCPGAIAIKALALGLVFALVPTIAHAAATTTNPPGFPQTAPSPSEEAKKHDNVPSPGPADTQATQERAVANPLTIPQRQQTRKTNSRPVLIVTVSALVVVACGFGCWFYLRPRRRPGHVSNVPVGSARSQPERPALGKKTYSVPFSAPSPLKVTDTQRLPTLVEQPVIQSPSATPAPDHSPSTVLTNQEEARLASAEYSATANWQQLRDQAKQLDTIKAGQYDHETRITAIAGRQVELDQKFKHTDANAQRLADCLDAHRRETNESIVEAKRSLADQLQQQLERLQEDSKRKDQAIQVLLAERRDLHLQTLERLDKDAATLSAALDSAISPEVRMTSVAVARCIAPDSPNPLKANCQALLSRLRSNDGLSLVPLHLQAQQRLKAFQESLQYTREGLTPQPPALYANAANDIASLKQCLAEESRSCHELTSRPGLTPQLAIELKRSFLKELDMAFVTVVEGRAAENPDAVLAFLRSILASLRLELIEIVVGKTPLDNRLHRATSTSPGGRCARGTITNVVTMGYISLEDQTITRANVIVSE